MRKECLPVFGVTMVVLNILSLFKFFSQPFYKPHLKGQKSGIKPPLDSSPSINKGVVTKVPLHVVVTTECEKKCRYHLFRPVYACGIVYLTRQCKITLVFYPLFRPSSPFPLLRTFGEVLNNSKLMAPFCS